MRMHPGISGEIALPPSKLGVMSQPATTFYEAVGGEETFRRLVHRFYQGVA
jgi:Bacterial-like globin